MNYAAYYGKLSAKLALLCSVILITGCGSDGSPGREGVEGAFSSQAIWESGCLDSDRFGLTMFSRFEIEGEAFRRVTQYHSDGTCSELSIESVEEGTLVRTPATDGSPSGSIDFNYQRVDVSPRSQPGINALNAVVFCGSNTWVIGQNRNVTNSSGSNCWDQTPRTVRDIYSVSGSDITFGVGTEKQKSGSASRPTALDPNRIWKIR